MTLNRRQVLAGAAGTLAAVQPAFIPKAQAQAPVVLQWWFGGGLPKEQRAACEFQIKTFEDENPGVKVALQAAPDEQASLMLSAAFASKQLPSVVTNLAIQIMLTYADAGLLLPMNYLIDQIGPDKFYENIHKIYEITPGTYAATCYQSVPSDMLWIRQDLLQKAGIDAIPTTWDQLRAACQKMQKGGIYGAPLPYAANSMTSAIIMGTIHRAGGQIFSPDLDVALDSQQTIDALEFYTSMRELCPPGATSYSWTDSLQVFVSGRSATAIYSGRLLYDLYNQNPEARDHVGCTVYPTISKSVAPWTFNTYAGVMIPKDTQNLELAKKFAVHLYRHDGYLKQILSQPGRAYSTLKSIIDDPVYKADPLVNKYSQQMQAMTLAGGYNLSKESDVHKRNLKAGEVISSGILGEVVQRVCLNRENVKTVLGDAAKKIEKIAKA